MTTCNFDCTSLLHSKVVRVQSEQDNQGYKEMKEHVLIPLCTLKLEVHVHVHVPCGLWRIHPDVIKQMMHKFLWVGRNCVHKVPLNCLNPRGAAE